MTIRKLAAAIVSLAALASAPARAEEAPVSTAANAASVPSVADQISAYLDSSPAAALPQEGAPGVISAAPRGVHGEVSVAVGTNGYRSVYARTDMPLGESGRLSVAIQDGRMNGRFGARQGRSLGLGLALGAAATDQYQGPCREPGLGGRRTFDGGYEFDRCTRPMDDEPRL